MNANKLRVLLYAVTAVSLLSTVFGDSLLSSLSVTLCGIVTGIEVLVGILALALFLVGGILYALAHFIPTSVDFRKAMTGWATSLIVAAIIGLIVVVLARPLVGLFTSLGGTEAKGFATSGCP